MGAWTSFVKFLKPNSYLFQMLWLSRIFRISARGDLNPVNRSNFASCTLTLTFSFIIDCSWVHSIVYLWVGLGISDRLKFWSAIQFWVLIFRVWIGLIALFRYWAVLIGLRTFCSLLLIEGKRDGFTFGHLLQSLIGVQLLIIPFTILMIWVLCLGL